MEDVTAKQEELAHTATLPVLPSTEDEPEKESGADADENQTTAATKKVKIRKRKKALHTAIKNQMEFYFSDANLSKDRFMQNVIKDGPGNFISFSGFCNAYILIALICTHV